MLPSEKKTHGASFYMYLKKAGPGKQLLPAFFSLSKCYTEFYNAVSTNEN